MFKGHLLRQCNAMKESVGADLQLDEEVDDDVDSPSIQWRAGWWNEIRGRKI